MSEAEAATLTAEPEAQVEEAVAEPMSDEEILAMLTPEFAEACQSSPQLLRYVRTLPLRESGPPLYMPILTRKAGEQKAKNLIYPVSDEVYIHVLTAHGEERDLYIPIEPNYQMDVSEKFALVESLLLDHVADFAELQGKEERAEKIKETLEVICKGGGSGKHKKGGKGLNLTDEEYLALRHLVIREKVGLGVLEPMVLDKNIEDISGSGIGYVFLEHKVFKSMKSLIGFETHEELDLFVLRLSEQIKRPVTMRNPIVDAVLPDGSRINIVYGREVSQRGSNFTIRKFSDTPISILELIEFGSISYQMAAYLWMILEEGMNGFVSGETASGKTTLINAILTFIAPAAKIVTIEDTPEVQVPHHNWLREVAKNPRPGEKSAAVTMMDLLKAALRQRPNLIIIGEIRGEEGAVAFQAMQTGHAVMATFHASSVEKLIQRLTGHPINIPKTYVDNLNVVILQSAVKLPTGKMGRRAIGISEIVGYDPTTNSFSYIEVFRWDPVKDKFEFVGDKNSYLLEQKIAPRYGIPPKRKWEIYNHMEKRARILEKIHKNKITGYHELYRVLAQAQRDGLV